jgi:hypothetical protein
MTYWKRINELIKIKKSTFLSLIFGKKRAYNSPINAPMIPSDMAIGMRKKMSEKEGAMMDSIASLKSVIGIKWNKSFIPKYSADCFVMTMIVPYNSKENSEKNKNPFFTNFIKMIPSIGNISALLFTFS